MGYSAGKGILSGYTKGVSSSSKASLSLDMEPHTPWQPAQSSSHPSQGSREGLVALGVVTPSRA